MERRSKRWISVLLILMMTVLLSACGDGTGASEAEEPAETPAEVPAESPEEVTDQEERGEPFPEAEMNKVDEEIISEMQESVRTLQWVKEATENGEVIGFLILVTPTSYGGPMEVFTAINVNGTIIQVDIGEHEDSDGIGTQVENLQYLNRYNGIDSASGIAAVDGISGATMSSGGVKDGVNRAYTIFETYLKNN